MPLYPPSSGGAGSGWDPFRLDQFMDGNGVDDPTGFAAAVTAWQSTQAGALADNPTEASVPFFVPDGEFVADGEILTDDGAGCSIFGMGRTSQLSGVGIEVDGRTWSIFGITLSGAGDFGLQFTGGSNAAEISHVYINQKTHGIEHLNSPGAQYLVSNVHSKFNAWGNYCYDVNANYTNCIIGNNTIDGLHLEEAGQLKMANCNINNNGRFNIYMTGTTAGVALESYYAQCTMSGALQVREIPMKSVADNGSGFARITVAATVVVSSVADAGNRMVCNFYNDPATEQAQTYIAITGVANTDSMTSLTVGGGSSILAGTVTATSSSENEWAVAIAASINLGTGTHGFSAEALKKRVFIYGTAGDFTANWKEVVTATTGSVTFNNPKYVAFTLATAIADTAAGELVYVDGTTNYNEVHCVAYISGDAKTIGTRIPWVSSQPGTMIPHFSLNDGIIGWTAMGSVYTDEFKISAVGPDPVLYYDSNMPFVSNDTGFVKNKSWDLYVEAKDTSSRCSDQFFTGGNINFTNLISCYNFAFNGTRLKEQFYVQPMANETLRPNMILRMGTLRGRDEDSYTPIQTGGALRGWAEIGMGDDSTSKLPGDAYVTMRMPSTAQGRTNGRATSLNSYMVYEDKLTLTVEGFTATFDNTGWNFPGLHILNLASSVNYLQIKASTTGNDIVLNTIGSDTDRTIQIKAGGSGGRVKLQSASGQNQISISDTGVGFYNIAPKAQPTITGSRGGNAALADLLTELATLGLIVDSSSA